MRDGTEKHGHSLVEGASRAVARMNQREIAQAQTVAANNATPSRRKARQSKRESVHAAPVSCNIRARLDSFSIKHRLSMGYGPCNLEGTVHANKAAQYFHGGG